MAQRRKIPADEYPKTEAAFVTSHSTGESELRPSINSGSSYLPPQLSAQRSTQNDPRNESQGLASSAFYETALLQSSRQSSSTDQLPLHHFAKNILSDWITGKIPQDHEPCLVMMACGVLLVHFQNHQLNATEHALCHDLINYTKTSLESQLPYPTQAILTGRNTPAYAPHHHSFLVRFLQYRQQQQASFPSEKQQHMNINETDPQLLQLSQMQQQRRHSNQHHQFFTHKSVQSGLTSMYPGATFARRPSASASPVLFGHDSHTVSEHAEQFPLHPPSIYRGYEEHCSGQPESKVPLIISTKSNFSSTETNPPQTSTFCPVCRRPLQKPSNRFYSHISIILRITTTNKK